MAGTEKTLEDSVASTYGFADDVVENDTTTANDEQTTEDPAQSEQQQPDHQQQQEDDGESEQGDLFVPRERPLRDAQGNIVDKAGTILAQKGKESRIFFENGRLKTAVRTIEQKNQELAQRNAKLNADVAEYAHISALPKALGLSNDAVVEALNIRGMLERDPVKGVQEIVARVLGMGYTMDQLFTGDSTKYINGRAVEEALDRRLKPITDRFTQEQRQVEVNQEADRAYTSFVQQHEYAEVHSDAIANLMSQGEKPEMAYLKLENFAIRNGLDFTQPLGDQIAAMQQRGAQQATQQRVVPQAPQNLPGSRRPVATQQPAQINQPQEMASASDDWRTIINKAMSMSQR